MSLLACAQSARAQDTAAVAPPHPGERLTVYLATIGQGDQVWEKFGHNTIWIRDAMTRTTISYNYGIFEFGPGFISAFVRGLLLYKMEVYSADAELAAYQERNRTVWLQRLNMTPAQKDSLRVFLEWNALEHNKHYRYHYFYDNCSTRVRDALDRALGGAIRAQLAGKETGTTYRWHSLRLVGADVAVYTGLSLGLGQPTDRQLDAWDESFIPMQLMAHLRSVRVPGPDGAPAPLVVEEQQLFAADRAAEATVAPTRWPIFLLVSTLLGALLVLLSRRARVRPRAAFGLAVALSVWGVVTGFFGIVLALLWIATDHTTSYANQNLLQVNPLGFVLAVAASLAVSRRARAGRLPVARLAWRVAIALLALSCLGLLLRLIPGVGQVNGPIIALVLPLHLATVLSLYRTVGPDTSSREDVSARMMAAAALLVMALALPL